MLRNLLLMAEDVPMIKQRVTMPVLTQISNKSKKLVLEMNTGFDRDSATINL